ncbi:LOW QUALITY PROTEIN: pleckstrin homology domain-containing family A member 6 [Callorhinchus milii]|uniref:LOW QUALITY PROTEIN: pleckstrin homology domain-containing family A member 6 n=1 Tax=Callorhinchus milii TaxID=7868 RepID=UPI001C3F8CC1|nr:LOW QUALITY PROTEIN: pleckstrin homology domain-containing family A member 6 [Callorhinchus milii]
MAGQHARGHETSDMATAVQLEAAIERINITMTPSKSGSAALRSCRKEQQISQDEETVSQLLGEKGGKKVWGRAMALQSLPDEWSYGVTRDGRVFFIDDGNLLTTWLHPMSGQAMQTGNRYRTVLPAGWEQAFTFEGATYFINHNERATSFKHPVTGVVPIENCIFTLEDKPKPAMSSRGRGEGGNRPTSIASEMSNQTLVSETSGEQSHGRQASRSSKKGVVFGKRSNSMKRNPKANVTRRGWLYKQASSGVKSWNKRWFVLADRCLFYYRDEKEEAVLASIPLFSFRISSVQPTDNIARKHAFKLIVIRQAEVFLNNDRSIDHQAEHAGIRTYYLCAENKAEMEAWINAMNEAASVQAQPPQRIEASSEKRTAADENHVSNHKRLIKPDMGRVRGDAHGFGVERYERKTDRRALGRESGRESGQEPAPPKVNGTVLPEAISDPNSPGPELRSAAGNHRPAQPNGHNVQQHPSPGRPGNANPLQDNAVHRRGFVPRTSTEKQAQRQSSLSQLQQWVDQRRGGPPSDGFRSPQGYHTPTRGTPDYPGQFTPYYQEDLSQFYQVDERPDSISSVPMYDRTTVVWSMEDRSRSVRAPASFQLRDHQVFSGQGSPVWHGGGHQSYVSEMDHVAESLRRFALQPRSRSVPRSPSQGPLVTGRMYSPVRSPSARMDRLPPRREEMMGDPVYTLRRSRSNKYDYPGDRRSLPSPMYSLPFSVSPSLQDRMAPYQDQYLNPLHLYKPNDLEIDKLLSRLCEQTKNQREQEKWVLQLRKEKESLERALETTHREIALFRSQPAYAEQLVQKKESLQNKLVNIRGELSQATTAFASTKIECDALQMELSIIHNDIWQQLNNTIGMQNEFDNKHAQKLLWRIQDVMEGLRKSYPDRLTADSIKLNGTRLSPWWRECARELRCWVTSGQVGTFSSNSPASPLSSTSLTSPVSPFSPVSGSQSSAQPPVSEQFTVDPSRIETRGAVPTSLDNSMSQARQDPETEKQGANKVGVVPPRTKSPPEELSPSPSYSALRTSDKDRSGSLIQERPKSGGFQSDPKSKMSVEEQNDRMKRHQNGSLRNREKRRSLNLPPGHYLSADSSPRPTRPRFTVPRRKTTEIDISDLEAAVRDESSESYHETPREEIARLRRMELEPEHYSVDINKELSTPDKVFIPERYIEFEPEVPLSAEEMIEKQRKVERIKTLIAKSSLQNIVPLTEGVTELSLDPELQLQEQEKRIEISCTLATEASRRSRLLSVPGSGMSSPSTSSSPNPSPPPLPADGSHLMCV